MRVRRKKVTMEVRDMKNMEDSSESKGEGDESGREWLNKFSTMKVGLPKHTKPMTELKGLSSEAKVITCRVTSRLAGVEVKRRLKKFHKHLPNSLLYQTNELKFLLILWISIRGLRALFG